MIRAQEVEDLEKRLSLVHISEEQSEYQEESEEQDIQDTESEANETGNKEELDELSNVPSVGQPKKNMSRTCSGTPAPMARMAPALAEVVNHKSIVPEPGWFNRDKKMFEDLWRAIKLYLRANKVTDADKKIIVVLGRFQEGTAGAFAQQKLDKIDGGDNTPSWDAFKAELQLVYSNKTKEADAE